MKIAYFIVLFVCLSGAVRAQLSALPVERVDSVMAEQPKPLLILLSTDWCQYCRLQKHQLAKNEEFLGKRNLFHYVEFDAETKDPIQFDGQQYVFKPTGNKTGIHELAVALNGEGTIAFPTWVLLDQEFNPLFRHKGALAPNQIQELIVAIEQHESNSQKPNNDNQ